MAERFAKLVVLDLDETLIHARGRGEPDLPWPPHRQVAQYRVYLRPGARELLATLVERFVAVGIWTSASTEYATAMTERVVDRRKLRFIYTREHCEQRRGAGLDDGYWLKDIASLDGFGFDPARIIVVDDKPRGLERSADNLVQIPPFMGDPGDRMLDALERLLLELGPVADVRAVDKRGWWT